MAILFFGCLSTVSFVFGAAHLDGHAASLQRWLGARPRLHYNQLRMRALTHARGGGAIQIEQVQLLDDEDAAAAVADGDESITSAANDAARLRMREENAAAADTDDDAAEGDTFKSRSASVVLGLVGAAGLGAGLVSGVVWLAVYLAEPLPLRLVDAAAACVLLLPPVIHPTTAA